MAIAKNPGRTQKALAFAERFKFASNTGLLDYLFIKDEAFIDSLENVDCVALQPFLKDEDWKKVLEDPSRFQLLLYAPIMKYKINIEKLNPDDILIGI